MRGSDYKPLVFLLWDIPLLVQKITSASPRNSKLSVEKLYQDFSLHFIRHLTEKVGAFKTRLIQLQES